MAVRGKFRPKNPEKYAGDPTNICFRSSWEIKMMRRLDEDANVVSWSSEEIVIPYRDRTTGRLRRYFPDFHMKRRDGKEFLIEVKPLRETLPPTREGKSEKRFMAECVTYGKNLSKWEAAERYAAERGWEFLKITERELGIR